ncbi:hypothetical protein MIND_00413500 [Mycena indigotica]|uniref:Uncharacterized protein n=1 Tax=Mycena indigotica TaxID=2126181 RepID=A0A8H6SVN7_9AGAR|nr:uncharacterized protein MIND_00413500 [Mycena indigotica]KAF7306229.1 hypothetical protein MIND_00413500 [Mycena indigotica]
MATIPMPARGDRNAPRFDSAKPHLWESLTEFNDAAKTYEDFKASVVKLYPGSDTDRKFAMSDLDALIGETGRMGILSRADYGEFYRKFVLITAHLITKNRLSSAEQSRAFRRAISPASLWELAHRRLQIKKPDVHPDDPYDLVDMNEAMEFVLAGSNADLSASASHPTSAESPSSTAAIVKQEPGVAAILDSINGLIKVLTTQQQLAVAAPPRPNLAVPRSSPGLCNIGAFVPSRILGANLRDRIDEYHRQNPGQLAAGQLMLDLAPRTAPVAVPAQPVAPAFVLSEADRIESLERELFALKTRAQARAAIAAGEPVERPEQPIRAQSVPSQPPVPPPAENPPVPRILPRPVVAPVVAQPEHPFAKARDAVYAPPA